MFEYVADKTQALAHRAIQEKVGTDARHPIKSPIPQLRPRHTSEIARIQDIFDAPATYLDARIRAVFQGKEVEVTAESPSELEEKILELVGEVDTVEVIREVLEVWKPKDSAEIVRVFTKWISAESAKYDSRLQGIKGSENYQKEFLKIITTFPLRRSVGVAVFLTHIKKETPHLFSQARKQILLRTAPMLMVDRDMLPPEEQGTTSMDQAHIMTALSSEFIGTEESQYSFSDVLSLWDKVVATAPETGEYQLGLEKRSLGIIGEYIVARLVRNLSKALDETAQVASTSAKMDYHQGVDLSISSRDQVVYLDIKMLKDLKSETAVLLIGDSEQGVRTVPNLSTAGTDDGLDSVPGLKTKEAIQTRLSMLEIQGSTDHISVPNSTLNTVLSGETCISYRIPSHIIKRLIRKAKNGDPERVLEKFLRAQHTELRTVVQAALGEQS